jgi:hypothetical protein
LKVLFIGNSHTYFNDMPHLFAKMCEALTGEQTDVTMLAFSNRRLDWHCEEYFSVRFALLYGRYDYCVIQQFGHPIPPIEETEPPLEKHVNLCECVGTKPLLYMTWAKRDEPEKAPLISGIYRTLAEKHHALLAPIAELFEALRTEHPEIDLYWFDGSHASPYGDYLIAATFAALLTGQTDLSKLSDSVIDFRVRFEKGKNPKAIEDAEAVETQGDPKITAILREYARHPVRRESV